MRTTMVYHSLKQDFKSQFILVYWSSLKFVPVPVLPTLKCIGTGCIDTWYTGTSFGLDRYVPGSIDWFPKPWSKAPHINILNEMVEVKLLDSYFNFLLHVDLLVFPTSL